MINTANATLYQRPKALNAVGVDVPINVNLCGMIDDLMVKSLIGKRVIGTHFIGVNGSGFSNPLFNLRDKGCLVCASYDHRRNPALALHDAEHGGFIGCTPASKFIPLGSVHIDCLTADIGLVRLNLAVKVAVILAQQGTDLLEHSPRCFISNAQFPLQLFSGDTASGGSHEVHGIEPRAQGCLGLVEYAVSGGRYMRTAEVAGIYLAVGYAVMSSYLVALGAKYAVRVAELHQGIKTGVFIGELLVKFFDGKLCGFHVLFSTFILYLNYSTKSPCRQGIYYKDFIKKSVLSWDTYQMNCPISKFSGKTIKCDEKDCGLWDIKKEQCSFLTYMQAYFAMGIMTSKLVELQNKIIDNEDKY